MVTIVSTEHKYIITNRDGEQTGGLLSSFLFLMINTIYLVGNKNEFNQSH
jgi:hypothetical protein